MTRLELEAEITRLILDGSRRTRAEMVRELLVKIIDYIDQEVVEGGGSGSGPSYLQGDEATDGSVRLRYDLGDNSIYAEKRILGIWTIGVSVCSF